VSVVLDETRLLLHPNGGISAPIAGNKGKVSPKEEKTEMKIRGDNNTKGKGGKEGKKKKGVGLGCKPDQRLHSPPLLSQPVNDPCCKQVAQYKSGPCNQEYTVLL
jgi:hypothetical protein